MVVGGTWRPAPSSSRGRCRHVDSAPTSSARPATCQTGVDGDSATCRGRNHRHQQQRYASTGGREGDIGARLPLAEQRVRGEHDRHPETHMGRRGPHVVVRVGRGAALFLPPDPVVPDGAIDILPPGTVPVPRRHFHTLDPLHARLGPNHVACDADLLVPFAANAHALRRRS